MGEAFNEAGQKIAEAWGHTKREVFEKLSNLAPEAAEVRIRHSTMPESPAPVTTGPLASPLASSPKRYPSEGVTLDNVEDVFHYHPWGPMQREQGDQVREALVAAVKVILRVVPAGPDRSVAIRKVREAGHDSNSAITHFGRF